MGLLVWIVTGAGGAQIHQPPQPPFLAGEKWSCSQAQPFSAGAFFSRLQFCLKLVPTCEYAQWLGFCADGIRVKK